MKTLFILLFPFLPLFSKTILDVGYLIEADILAKKHSNIVVNVISKQVNKIDKNVQYNLNRYTKIDKILEDYKKEKIKAIAISTHNYFDNKTLLNKLSQKAWAINYTNSKYEQYYLIKNKASSNTFNDIYKSDFYIKEGSFPSRIWLNYILMDKFKKEYKNILKADSIIRKEYKLITRVFFNKNAMAIINKDVYNYVKEINPQILNKIEIIKESGNFFSSILLIAHKSISTNEFEKLEGVFKKFTTIFKGTGYDTLTKVQHLGINDIYLSKYENFYKNYKSLKKELLKNQKDPIYFSSSSEAK